MDCCKVTITCLVSLMGMASAGPERVSILCSKLEMRQLSITTTTANDHTGEDEENTTSAATDNGSSTRDAVLLDSIQNNAKTAV
eukprot:scaffold1712_cov84-Cyclotella_meneghiniana.AAC.3